MGCIYPNWKDNWLNTVLLVNYNLDILASEFFVAVRVTMCT